MPWKQQFAAAFSEHPKRFGAGKLVLDFYRVSSQVYERRAARVRILIWRLLRSWLMHITGWRMWSRYVLWTSNQRRHSYNQCWKKFLMCFRINFQTNYHQKDWWIFTVIDLAQGYHQTLVANNSKQYTAFRTHKETYHYFVAPMDLAGMPGIWSRLIRSLSINSLLLSCIWTAFASFQGPSHTCRAPSSNLWSIRY